MKKVFTKIVLAVLLICVSMATVFGCGGSSSKWNPDSVTLKNPSNVVSEGGFIAETENYLYFINGVGTATSDNTFGAPLKGALMAAEKSNLSNQCVVVPKLFVASDYTAGVYIYDGYVYYGSPSTDKNTSGSIAYDQMMLLRTKLDGTGTEVFLTLNTTAADYRVVKGSDAVYFVYYDNAAKSLKTFNTATRTEQVIAKTDVKVESESLLKYEFMSNEQLGETIVVYTVDVYAEPYNEKAETAATNSGSTYTRVKESYNRVYSYKLGDTGNNDCLGKKVLDGEGNYSKTYEISNVFDEYVFYTVKDVTGTPETSMKVNTVAGLRAESPATDVENDEYAVYGTVIISLDEVYVYDEAGFIEKTTLVGDKNQEEDSVNKVSTVKTLLFIEGDYIYYLNSSSNLARIKLNDATAKEERVSEGTISESWFAPQVIDGKVFYLDNSSTGNSYVKYVSLNATVEAKDTDDDGENDLFYLTGNALLGKKTDADIASCFVAKLNDITNDLEDGRIVFDAKDSQGKDAVQKVLDLRAEYDSFSVDAKNAVSDESLIILEKYEKATELSNILLNLKDFANMQDGQKNDVKDYYLQAKALIKQLEDSDRYVLGQVTDLVVVNLMYDYQLAQDFFED